MQWNELLCKERLSGNKFNENEELKLNPFERDYYTIVTSSYFRRLQKKTQVYVLDENDFSRTRLTHSMEVSAIAEMLGRRIGEHIEKVETNILPENFVEDLALVLRCSGLLHDLGNPPFGHSGEEYIRDFFQDNEEELRRDLPDEMWLDFINFEGNANNIRIVTKLGQSSNPEDNNYGMDLTCAIVNSLIKYPYSSMIKSEKASDSSGKHKRGKIGYYHSEDWIVEKMLTAKTGTKRDGILLKNPIMLIMEAADDIAYAIADVEDAVKKELIDQNDVIREIGNLLPKELEEGNIQDVLRYVREQTIIDVANEFMKHYHSIMDGRYSLELVNDPKFDIKKLKTLLLDIFKQRDAETELKHNSKQKVHDILKYLINIVTKDDISLAERLILKEMHQYLVKGEQEANHIFKKNRETSDKEKLYHQYLAVIDFVSGMTDSYVTIFWNKIFLNDYLKERIQEYKKDCLKSIMGIPQFNGFEAAKIALRDISYVDCWEAYEVAIIFRSYINNRQVIEAHNSKKVIGDLYAKYKCKVRSFMSDKEIGILEDSFLMEEI